MSFKEPEGQVARWLEELQSYEFTVVHRAGVQHGNADALSQRPCSVHECKYCERKDTREGELSSGTDELVRGVAPQVYSELQGVGVAEWAEKQQCDTALQLVMLWVGAQRRPSWEEVAALSPVVKGLWVKFNTLRLLDGVLQRAWVEPATGEKRWQVVVPKVMQEEVLKALHGSAGSGHFGVTKTLRRVRQGFYWGRLRRDVEDFCRCCDLCTARKGPQGQSRAQLQQFPVGEPMQRVGVDVMGPFPRTTQGNRFILTAMDYFTKWPEAYALPDQEAETVANALVEGMFSRFGVPIHSDQGRNFESRVFSIMCTRLGITKTRTTPLHPQSDGLVERFNRTLAEQLSILTSSHQQDWDAFLPLVLMACRSAVQSSTSCTPAHLMLGREIRTPAELAFGRPPDTASAPAGPEYARRLQDRLDTAHEYARG
uniref:Gypsy retrotransposon integrase-like protein 1 n=1 Tax=Paramormyrops kingsleyae TaxID=1676925 RepID=A0A3B3SFD3_9TELE